MHWKLNIILNVWYHCRAAALKAEDNRDQSDNFNHGIALAELVAYIDDLRMSADVAPVFKLSDLVKLYSSRLEQLGVYSKVVILTVLTSKIAF